MSKKTLVQGQGDKKIGQVFLAITFNWYASLLSKPKWLTSWCVSK